MENSWKQNYIDFKDSYTLFQDEVEIFLQNVLSKHKDTLDIVRLEKRTSGIKTMESIEQNIKNKKYDSIKSFFDIQDVAGLRVICNCEDDSENTTTVLEGEIRQKYGNVTRRNIGGIGSKYPYRAHHLFFFRKVQLNKKFANIFCEVQIRTITMDAWSTQSHKYLYKNKKEGDAQELTNAVSEIMNGCEKLWSLVKKKSRTGETVNTEVKKIEELGNEIIESAQFHTTSKYEQIKEWFSVNSKKAEDSMKKLSIGMSMEVKCIVTTSTQLFDKTQLKESARKSTISTFGWPIGVFIESKEEFEPKADIHGIHAELAIKESSIGESSTYDYWAIKQDATFYLLKSLFEETRKPDYIFFDTRIIRTTETLMYLRNLYKCLELPINSNLEITITYSGIIGKILSVASPNRVMFINRKSSVNVLPITVSTTIEEINTNINEVVEKFTKPLFEIFNFFNLDKKIHESIVENYINGKIV